MEVYAQILDRLDVSLEALENDLGDIIKRAEKGIGIARTALKDLRVLIGKESFKDQASEIYFFKCVKPQVLSKLIYYAKLLNIEAKRPRKSKKAQIKYLRNHIEKLQIYFNENLDFYHYYRRGATIFDKHYFLRGKANIRLFPNTFYFFIDEEFSTSHDSSVATIMAYDLLIVYLQKEIESLENNGDYLIIDSPHKYPKITWTSQKVNLIELIYALHSTDAINNGTADIKDIAKIVERIFKIDLGDYYRTFLEIRMRKRCRTKFLDLLKENLEKRMKEIDD